MEHGAADHHLLSDLALVYLALADDAEGGLSDAEVGAVAERLRTWQAEVPRETALGAIKEALASYELDDASRRVRQAIRSIQDHAPAEAHQQILDDLVEIVSADAHRLHEERAFIGELADAWGVAPTQQPALPNDARDGDAA